MPSCGPTKGSLEIIFLGIPEMYYDTLKASLRSADAFPLFSFGGREATTGNASALRRLFKSRFIQSEYSRA